MVDPRASAGTFQPKQLTWPLLGFLPGIVLAAFMARNAVDVPYMDQWELVPLLEETSAGKLALADLFAQHNEHIIFFPRLIMLALAFLSRWDVRWEMGCSWLLACGIYAALAYAAFRSRIPWLALPMGIAIFSAAQWQNFFLGWQMQIFLCVLAVIAALWSCQRDRGLRSIAAILAGVVASLSFGAGMLVWPCLLLAWFFSIRAIFLRDRQSPGWRINDAFRGFCSERGTKRRWAGVIGGRCFNCRGGLGGPPRVAIGTLVGFAFCACLYLPGYSQETHPASPTLVPATLGRAGYACVFLGGPLFPWSVSLSLLAGAIATIGFAVLVWRGRAHICIFWPALGLFAILCATLTAYARAGYGLEQALSSRYTTLALPLWIALLALLAEPLSRPRLAALALVTLGFCAGSLHGAYTWTLRYPAYIAAREQLLAGERVQELRLLYPDTEELARRRETLMKLGLSVFRP